MKIALDVMGTDNRPLPDIAGGLMAAQEYNDTILMVGDEKRIREELNNHSFDSTLIQIVSAEEEIGMDEKPSHVMKSKKNSSIHVGTQLVKDGLADAFVTMGNTGAAHAIATLNTLRRIPNVKRPALTGIYPIYGHNMIFVDVGANADVKPEWLQQFAIMGSIYAESVLKHVQPTVALLANGEEEGKGNQLTRDTYELLKQSPINFIGNIEPKDIMQGGCDVVVMDGFVGNIFVKMFEASITYFSGIIRDEVTADIPSKLGAVLTRPAFRRVRRRVDTFEVGGAPLLGVNGVVIIGHGRSNEIAVKNAINQARQAVNSQVIQIIQSKIS